MISPNEDRIGVPQIKRATRPHSAATSPDFAGVSLYQDRDYWIHIPGEGWVKWEVIEWQFDRAFRNWKRARAAKRRKLLRELRGVLTRGAIARTAATITNLPQASACL